MSTIRIHRYIIREITVPTILGLVIFTFVLLMGRILKLVEMVINKGVPLAETAKLFLYLLPTFLVITLPLAFLLGVLLGFGRLSADSEVVALKSCGVSLVGMLKPVILLGLLVALLTGILTLFLEPRANNAFRNQVFQIASSRASIGIQPRVFNDEFEGLILYANEIDERRGRMEGLFISDERVGSTPAIIMANSGHIVTDRTTRTLTLRLSEGSIHRRPAGRDDVGTYQVIGFTTYDINLNMGRELPSIEDRKKKESELTIAELQRARRETDSVEQRHQYTAELLKRAILPLSPLLFGLIGVPFGIQSHRSGRGGGFALALFVFLGYYLLLSFAETLSVEAGLSPWAVMWLPPTIFLCGGGYLLYLAAMEKRFVLLDRIQAIPLIIQQRLRRRKG